MLKHFGDLGHSLYFACTENSYPNLSSTLRKYERRKKREKKKKSMNDAQLHLSSASSRIVFSKQYPQPNLCLIIAFLCLFFFNCLCFYHFSTEEKVFPDKRKANPVWNEKLTHSLEWQTGVMSLAQCEMGAVYVWQSGRKQFLIIAVPSYIKVQIVLFTVLQTNKTRILPLLEKNKKNLLVGDTVKYPSSCSEWTAPSAFPATCGSSWVTLQTESLPTSENTTLALLCLCLESPSSSSQPAHSCVPRAKEGEKEK